MKTREEAQAYALSFPKTYQEAPFHDNNWQLVRVEGSKKAFLWTYEREGYINLNVKADPQWRDFWRSTYASVIPGWQQNKGSKKTILWISEREEYINLNVKVNPEWRDFWRSAYESVTAGYHLNKEHWNTINLDGTIPEEEIKRMIAESYDLVTDSPTRRIYEAVKKIPRGKVATYGQVAEMAGNKKMARAV